MKKLLYVLPLAFTTIHLAAQVGFNLVGYINQEGGTNSSLYQSVALDRNNKILVVGQTDGNDFNGLIARYNENGTLDTTFNAGSVNGGPGYINIEGDTNSRIYYSVAVDRNNKIVAVGRTDNSNGLIARYNENGTLDTATFNTGSVDGAPGFINTDTQTSADFYYAVVIDRNNKILVVGQTFDMNGDRNGLIARYLENGTLDTLNFNAQDGFINVEDGTNSYVYYSVVIDKNNKIVVVGQTIFPNADRCGLIARYNENGELDTTFNVTGYRNTNETGAANYYSVVIDENNKIVVVGQTTNDGDGVIARYHENGELDTTFNGTGYSNQAGIHNVRRYYGVMIDSNNKIVAVGSTNTNNGLIVRYNANGSLDTTFNKTGYINLAQPTNSSEYYSVVFDGNHKICAVGQTKAQVNDQHGSIARYLSNGVLDADSNWNSQSFRESAQINNTPIGIMSR